MRRGRHFITIRPAAQGESLQSAERASAQRRPSGCGVHERAKINGSQRQFAAGVSEVFFVLVVFLPCCCCFPRRRRRRILFKVEDTQIWLAR